MLICSLLLTAAAGRAQTAAAPDSIRTVAQPAVTAAAQPRFGYFSYQAALESMPEYAVAQKQIASLQAKYEAETKRSEDDFNKKYEEFLDGQRDFPKTILEKRQSELQELMARNIAFRKESERLLKMAEKDAMAPLYDRLSKMLNVIGEREHFDFIINTDANSCPFINPAAGKDINQLVKDCLK